MRPEPFSQQPPSEQLPLRSPAIENSSGFLYWPFDIGNASRAPTLCPRSIFARTKQKQEAMANWRGAARLMMQYNGHLPIPSKHTDMDAGFNKKKQEQITEKSRPGVRRCSEASLDGSSVSGASSASRWGTPVPGRSLPGPVQVTWLESV